MAKHLNPLEKEFLILQFKEHSRMKLSPAPKFLRKRRENADYKPVVKNE